MERITDRRTILKGIAALGAALAARPLGAWAGQPLGGLVGDGASRTSLLPSSGGLTLFHSDLHNHSLISGDAFGRAQDFYAQMKAKGMDVACLTEHAISGKGHGELTCPGHEQGGCHTVEGINDTDWAYMKELADAAHDPANGFITFRAFEWSTPTIGHLNVYFTEEYTDALREHAFFTPPAAAEIDRVAPVPSEIVDLFEETPDIATMRYFWQWLASDPDRDLFGGGNDGIACFNHPNEFGDFEAFRFDPAAGPHVVQIEALNADRDFFFWDAHKGKPNPINACLNAGWRVGFLGVSDEHGTEFARPGMARAGLWMDEFSRAGVRRALESRRTFATFEPGLRLDATANGVPMGSTLAHESGPVAIELDIARGDDWVGKHLTVQVVRPGSVDPVLAAAVPIVVPSSGTISFAVDVRRDEGDWLFLRLCDAERPADANATPAFAAHGGAAAYLSPWFLGG